MLRFERLNKDILEITEWGCALTITLNFNGFGDVDVRTYEENCEGKLWRAGWLDYYALNIMLSQPDILSMFNMLENSKFLADRCPDSHYYEDEFEPWEYEPDDGRWEE